MQRGTITHHRGKFRVRYRLANGKRVTIDVCETRDLAERVLDAWGEHVAANPDAAQPMTVAEWGARWLKDRALAQDDGVKDASSWMRNQITNDTVGRTFLRDLRRHHVVAWLRRLDRKGLAPQSVANALNVLRQLLHAALDHSPPLVKENVAVGVRPRVKRRAEEPWTYLTPAEQARFIASFRTPERWIVAFAIGTGLRAGELAGLHLSDLDVDGTNPHVVVRFGSPNRKKTKTKRSVRVVPLFGLGLESARAWLAQLPTYCPHNPKRIAFPRPRGGYRDKAHVLPWSVPKGHAVPAEGFATWSDAVEAASFGRNVRWHDLRHTFASSLLSGWWGRYWRLEEIRPLLGHMSATTTERYAHLAQSALREAADATAGLGHAGVTPGEASPPDSPVIPPGAASGDRTPDLRFTNSSAFVRFEPNSALTSTRDPNGDPNSIAREVIQAVVSGDASGARRKAERLVLAVLGGPVVRLALEAAQGGPLALVRAVRLAEMVLEMETVDRSEEVGS